MDNKQLQDAMNYLDPQLIQEASQPAARKPRRFRTLLIAACLCLAIIPAMAATSNLLVNYYFGTEIPKHLDGQDLDAYYEVTNTYQIPISSLSEEVRQAAESQGANWIHHGFNTWEEMEEFLGIDIFENEILSNAVPQSVELTDADGQVILDAPCTLLLVTNPEGELISVHINYYCLTDTGKFLSVTATASTELNDYDNAGGYGISYEEGEIISQNGENYLTKSGAESTIVSSQNSVTGGWDVDGWILLNGFTVRVNLSETVASLENSDVKQILDAFE